VDDRAVQHRQRSRDSNRSQMIVLGAERRVGTFEQRDGISVVAAGVSARASSSRTSPGGSASTSGSIAWHAESASPRSKGFEEAP
jgi:hypothetical protein